MEWSESDLAKQAWAARQDPPLVTTKKAMELLGVGTSVSVGQIMKAQGVVPQKFPVEQDAKSNFYDLAEVQALVEIRKGKRRSNGGAGKHGGRKKEEQPARIRLDGVDLSRVPRMGWTKDQVVVTWGRKDGHNIVLNLCDRCPSFFQLPINEAVALVSELGKSGEHVGQLEKAKRDKGEFIREARRIAAGSERDKLINYISIYYEGRNFCRLDPRIAVAILHELMVNK